MTLSVWDLALIMGLSIFAILGAFNGLIKEIIALLRWVFIGIALYFLLIPLRDILLQWQLLPLSQISATALAFFLITFAGLLIGLVIHTILTHLVRFLQLSFVNRFLGAVFGATKIWLLAAVVAGIVINCKPNFDLVHRGVIYPGLIETTKIIHQFWPLQICAAPYANTNTPSSPFQSLKIPHYDQRHSAN